MPTKPSLKKIFKYLLPIKDGPVTLTLPAGSKVVHVGLDPADRLSLWAEFDVDSEVANEIRTFEVVGTGHLIDGSLAHLGSVVDKPFVWHVYEKVTGAGRSP